MIHNYQTITNILEQFAANHLAVKRFQASFEDQLDQFADNDAQWPILYAVPQDISMVADTDQYRFRIYSLAQTQDDRSDEKSALTHTELILRDLTNWLRYNLGNDLVLLNDPVIRPLNYISTEGLMGWVGDYIIESETESSDCAIPFSSNFAYTGTSLCVYDNILPFLTCDSIQYCPTIIEMNTSINYLLGRPDIYISGGTYADNTITLTNTTGGTVSITGITSGSNLLFPNGSEIVTESRDFQSSDEGKFLIVLSDSLVQLTMPSGIIFEGGFSLGISGVNNVEFQKSYNGAFIRALGQINGGQNPGEHDAEPVLFTTYPDDGDGNSLLVPLSTSIMNDNGEFKTMLKYLYDRPTGGDSYWISGSTGVRSLKPLGNNGDAQGDNSFILGFGNVATGENSIATGQYTFAQGGNSIATGFGTGALGGNSFAGGNDSQAIGANAIAFGDSTYVNGDYSVALGGATEANGMYSFVFGHNSYAQNENTIVLGAGIDGVSADTTYVDQFNIKTPLSTPAVSNLGIDAEGFVVLTTGGTGADLYTQITSLADIDLNTLDGTETLALAQTGSTAAYQISLLTLKQILSDNPYSNGIVFIDASRDLEANDEGKLLVMGNNDSTPIILTMPTGQIFQGGKLSMVFLTEGGYQTSPTSNIVYPFTKQCNGNDENCQGQFLQFLSYYDDEFLNSGLALLSSTDGYIKNPLDNTKSIHLVKYLYEHRGLAVNGYEFVNSSRDFLPTDNQKILFLGDNVEMTLQSGTTFQYGDMVSVVAIGENVKYQRTWDDLDLINLYYGPTGAETESVLLVPFELTGSTILGAANSFLKMDELDGKRKTALNYLMSNLGRNIQAVEFISTSRDWQASDVGKGLILDANVALTMPSGVVWNEADLGKSIYIIPVSGGTSFERTFGSGPIYSYTNPNTADNNTSEGFSVIVGETAGQSDMAIKDSFIINDTFDGLNKTAYRYIMDTISTGLQGVTNRGVETTNNIHLVDGSANRIVSLLTDSGYGSLAVRTNDDVNSIVLNSSGTYIDFKNGGNTLELRTDNLSGNTTVQMPNTDGILVNSVNNQQANDAGNVSVTLQTVLDAGNTCNTNGIYLKTAGGDNLVAIAGAADGGGGNINLNQANGNPSISLNADASEVQAQNANFGYIYVGGGGVEIADAAAGIILKAPDGGRWRVTVDNSGTLITTSI